MICFIVALATGNSLAQESLRLIRADELCSKYWTLFELRLNSGDVVTYKAGESWVEPPGTVHSHSKNPSETETAKILAVLIAKEGATLTRMEKTE